MKMAAMAITPIAATAVKALMAITATTAVAITATIITKGMAIMTKALIKIDPAVMPEILFRKLPVYPLEAKANSNPLDSKRCVELAEEANLSRKPVATPRLRSPTHPLRYGNSILCRN